MIDSERLLNWHFPEILHQYTPDDTMQYGLAIGLGSEPTDERQLRFVIENGAGPLHAFPTMAVILGYPGSWLADPATGVDFSRVVHGEEEIRLRRPLAPSGTVIARHKVVNVIDKGAGKGAIIIYDKELFDRQDGAHLATVRHTSFARGDGGFSSGAPTPPADAKSIPVIDADRTPDRVCEIRTLPQQALLYRLCADRNPLHSDPATARSAGFDRPILHGLCTFAIAGRAILDTWANYAADQLHQLSARFSSPVLPGETLIVEMFDEGATVAFRARVKERERLVLTHGFAILGTPPI